MSGDPSPQTGLRPGFRARAGLVLRNGAASLFPGYFALVMATGVVSIACHLLGLRLE